MNNVKNVHLVTIYGIYHSDPNGIFMLLWKFQSTTTYTKEQLIWNGSVCVHNTTETIRGIHHQKNVTCVLRYLESPATRLFVQHIDIANKKKIKAPQKTEGVSLQDKGRNISLAWPIEWVLCISPIILMQGIWGKQPHTLIKFLFWCYK